jgi:hypothetical protein
MSILSRLERIARTSFDALAASRQNTSATAHWLARRFFDEIQNSDRGKEPKRLLRYTDRVFSQGNEDGVLREIFQRVGIASHTAIEVGTGDGTENNTMYLLFQGWKCLWVEADTRLTTSIVKTHQRWLQSGTLRLHNSMISQANTFEIIGPFAQEYGDRLDLLSIDIDSQDYWVLQAALKFAKPRVVVIEYNGNLPPSVSITVPLNHSERWSGGVFYGASLAALNSLLEKDYALVGCTPNGVNAFWVRRDLKLSEFAEPFTVENHFQPWPFPPLLGNRVDWVRV